VLIVLKSGSLNLLEPSGPVMGLLWLLPSIVYLLTHHNDSAKYSSEQAQELISRPCLGTKVRILSFIRMQSMLVTVFLTRHNTLRRHLHLMWLIDSPSCKKCGAEDETTAHIVCRCEALESFSLVYLGFFLEPENIKSVYLGAIWNLSKATGLPYIVMGHKGSVK
jgi:hypothetical protein